ncbi:MICOS complex subunit MIC60-like [Ptychodera flava]|uniref:MICOS complex subunit MIC60-like n=1 Tax=Ptychodera flava TaxID=63121 RepID=UPI003969ECCC
MLRVACRFSGRVKCPHLGRQSAGRTQRCKLCTKPEGAAEAPPPPPPPAPVKKSRGFLKFLGGVTVVTGGAIIGSVAYAKSNPEFRKQVESNWPFLVPILDQAIDNSKISEESIAGIKNSLYGMKDRIVSLKDSLPALPSISTPSKSPTVPITDIPKDELQKTETKSLLPKAKPAEESKPKTEVSEPKKAAEPVKEKKPTPEKKPAAAAVSKEEEKKAKKEREEREAKEREEKAAKELEERMIAQEIEEAADEAAMEVIVGSLLKSCEATSQQAVDSQTKAVDAIKRHTQQLKYAMDDTGSVDDKPIQWESVSGTLDAKKDAVAVAEMDLTTAKEEFEKLKQTIEEARAQASKSKSKFSSGPSPVVVEAEEALNKLIDEVDSAVAEVTSAKADSKIMTEYADLVEKGKQLFKKELESIMPDVKLGKKGKKLTEDELNSLIAHAHRRVEQLQKQLAEQQTREQQRVSSALEKQKEEDRRAADERVARELEKQRRDLLFKQHKDMANLSQDFETEMRQQLRRQAAAHSDHLKDVLRVQAKELDKQFEKREQEILANERERYQIELHGALARLRGVESAIAERADLEKQSQKAQELWLACESLKRTIRDGVEGAFDEDSKLKPLAEEITAVKEAGTTLPVIDGIIEAMPEQALTRGVVTEETLKSRWKHVRKVCKKVAMVDEVGGSMFQYLLSYVQSFLIIDNPRPPSAEEDIDPSTLDTFKLLAFADFHIKNGDLDQAVRYVNQLQGMPREVVSDWLKEAVLLLETSQVANMLSATASACGLGALCV